MLVTTQFVLIEYPLKVFPIVVHVSTLDNLYCNKYALSFLLFNGVILLFIVTLKLIPSSFRVPSALHLSTLNVLIVGLEYARTVNVVDYVAVLPLLSVTVTDTLLVALVFNTPVVNVFEV